MLPPPVAVAALAARGVCVAQGGSRVARPAAAAAAAIGTAAAIGNAAVLPAVVLAAVVFVAAVVVAVVVVGCTAPEVASSAGLAVFGPSKI